MLLEVRIKRLIELERRIDHAMTARKQWLKMLQEEKEKREQEEAQKIT